MPHLRLRPDGSGERLLLLRKLIWAKFSFHTSNSSLQECPFAFCCSENVFKFSCLVFLLHLFLLRLEARSDFYFAFVFAAQKIDFNFLQQPLTSSDVYEFQRSSRNQGVKGSKLGIYKKLFPCPRTSNQQLLLWTWAYLMLYITITRQHQKFPLWCCTQRVISQISHIE